MDLLQLWGQLLQLSDALYSLPRIPILGKEKQCGEGHQDIKPSNVLAASGTIPSPYEIHFKLADFSLNHFKIEKPSVEEIVDWDSYGTRIYGPLECYMEDDISNKSHGRSSQAVGVWSLGCIYREAMAWT
ncbi:hypothetical protein BGW36DRAFT_466308 [Talaromyces proteolyticus]|uniref:Protein kinase domain-containing protein n=1 Tax=Talaromyces proteolyticus TaxID=1131652 RepID=A0AAD4KJ02_9EURO|nr:uncharacterized protein BGW36DRAFT_466308 [Talaromyces proteolyticus]KAH8689423.1 hypothetical protein BGW36DRAFT_466308 [Talaromyces proteolyticus]